MNVLENIEGLILLLFEGGIVEEEAFLLIGLGHGELGE